MQENMCAGAHPGWRAFEQALPSVLSTRQRGRDYVAKIREIAKLVVNYQGIRARAGRTFRLVRDDLVRLFGFSASSTYRILKVLEAVGLIARVRGPKRRCHTGTTSSNPERGGVCFEPLDYVIGPRFRSYFVEDDGTEFAVSPAENQSEQKKLPNDSESSTGITAPDSERDSRDSSAGHAFLSALAKSVTKRAVITRVDYDRRSPPVPKLPKGYDPVAAELELLRQRQAETKAENDQRSQQGRAWSRFWPGGSRLR